MIDAALRTTIVLMGTFAIVLISIFGAGVLRGKRRKKTAALSAERLPKIRSSLVDYLAGNDDLTLLRQFVKEGRHDVLAAILSFQDSVAGSARDRLCALTLHLELLHEWRDSIRSRNAAKRRAAFAGIAFACAYEPCRRAVGDILVDALEDADPEVRISSAQALAQFGSAAEIILVFRMAVRANLLTRVLVAGRLRKQALELSRIAIPDELQSGDAARIQATLEMVVAWESALPLSGLSPLILHRDPAIRLLALQAVPLTTASRDNEAAVVQALDDSDTAIAMAAATAAGRLQIAGALPALVRCCSRGSGGLLRAAVKSIAALGPQGWKSFEKLAAEDAAVSTVAAEALARINALRSM